MKQDYYFKLKINNEITKFALNRVRTRMAYQN